MDHVPKPCSVRCPAVCLEGVIETGTGRGETMIWGPRRRWKRLQSVAERGLSGQELQAPAGKEPRGESLTFGASVS